MNDASRAVDEEYLKENMRPEPLATRAAEDWPAVQEWAREYTMATAESVSTLADALPATALEMEAAIGREGDSDRLGHLRAHIGELLTRRTIDYGEAENLRAAIDERLNGLLGGLQ